MRLGGERCRRTMQLLLDRGLYTSEGRRKRTTWPQDDERLAREASQGSCIVK